MSEAYMRFDPREIGINKDLQHKLAQALAGLWVDLPVTDGRTGSIRGFLAALQTVFPEEDLWGDGESYPQWLQKVYTEAMRLESEARQSL